MYALTKSNHAFRDSVHIHEAKIWDDLGILVLLGRMFSQVLCCTGTADLAGQFSVRQS